MRYFSPEHQQVAASSPRQQLLTNQRALHFSFVAPVCEVRLVHTTGHWELRILFATCFSPPPLLFPQLVDKVAIVISPPIVC